MKIIKWLMQNDFDKKKAEIAERYLRRCAEARLRRMETEKIKINHDFAHMDILFRPLGRDCFKEE